MSSGVALVRRDCVAIHPAATAFRAAMGDVVVLTPVRT